jgi:multiple sugar transport system ATP-binding protein
MEHLLDRKPGQLSGGQRQRVAIGRAIVRKPEVFLFDEPLSNLDAALRVDTRMEIAKLHADLGATMIYVTHDQVEAMTLADKIVVLDAGVVQQVGSPIELYQRPTNLFVAGFIGSPKMNFVEVTVEAIETDAIVVSSKDVASLRVPATSAGVRVGDKLTLGIRPHDLVPANNGAIVGRVSLVERLGNETIVNLELSSGTAWLAVLEGDQPLRVGESLALAAEPTKAILFDKDGKSLLAPLN